ncbi:type VI secretion system baseplate subunit TssF [Oxalobacteraceae bacterium A2-2]
MEQLLKYYESELSELYRLGADFAQRYPAVAGRLGLGAREQGDPHVERLIQALALLNARSAKRLDDSHRQFTEAMLEVNFPHSLRPFPACAIAQVAHDGSHSRTIIPRGTLMSAAERDGVICKFSTAYDVGITPLMLDGARYTGVIEAPTAVNMPRHAAAMISISLQSAEPLAAEQQPLRLHLAGEPSFAAALHDALFLHATAAFAELPGGSWTALAHMPLLPVGFGPAHALLPPHGMTHPAHRLMTEYFAFPAKFNFVDIDLGAIAAQLPPDARRMTLHLVLTQANTLLRTLGPQHLLSNCTPVVNLFSKAAAPIRINHTCADYPLLPDARLAHAYDIYSIDQVRVMREDQHAGAPEEFRPYQSLRHGEAGGAHGRYWVARRDDLAAASRPGFEYRMGLVDPGLGRSAGEARLVSVELTCSNRSLPTRLREGAVLRHQGPAAELPVRLLQAPTQPWRVGSHAEAHWRLISQLSLHHQALGLQGMAAFKEMLELHNLPRTSATQRQISGITGLSMRPGCIWMRDAYGGGQVAGLEITITVDEEAYVGGGLHVFAQLLEHVLGLYVHLNSYTRLVLRSQHSGQEILRCPPRNGNRCQL